MESGYRGFFSEVIKYKYTLEHFYTVQRQISWKKKKHLNGMSCLACEMVPIQKFIY